MVRETHDKTKHSTTPKMVQLPSSDPRCQDLPAGHCRMACDTCSFVTGPIKDQYLNKYKAQQGAQKAHTAGQDTALVPARESNRPLSSSLPLQQTRAPAFGLAPPRSTGLPLSSSAAPMEIDNLTLTHKGRSENSVTHENNTTRTTIERYREDGTIAEREMREEDKTTVTATQKAEYENKITRLTERLQEVGGEWEMSKAECTLLRDTSGACMDRFGMAVCDMILKKKPGIEHMLALLAIPRLLQMIDTHITSDQFEAWCQQIPSMNLGDPLIKELLQETSGAKAYQKLVAMTDEDVEMLLPSLAKAGLTPDLLRKLGIFPTVKAAVEPEETLSERGAIYFPKLHPTDNFKTDYAVGHLPSLLEEHYAYWNANLSLKIHLHLTRDDGERPDLHAIKSDGYRVQHTLPEYDYQIITCYVAYMCIWKHPKGKMFKCHVAEDLIRTHYPLKVAEYNQLYGIEP